MRPTVHTEFDTARHRCCGNIFQVCVFKVICSSVPINRYQYYLQVKKDVLEGRLRCALEQVIRLAGLAVQGKERGGRPARSHFLFAVLLASGEKSAFTETIPR